MKMRGLSMVCECIGELEAVRRGFRAHGEENWPIFSGNFTMCTEIIQLSGEISGLATDEQLPRAFVFTSGFCLPFF